jgi:hypothetical protein
MVDYSGSNSGNNLNGLTKEIYGEKIENLIPDTPKRPKFKRFKKILKIKD